MNPLAPVLCTSLPAAACAFAHYFPWRHFFKSGRMPRLYAYASGLLSVLLPATIAALAAAVTVADAIALLWLAAISAGLGTLIPWWYDWTKRAELQRQREADAAELFGDGE